MKITNLYLAGLVLIICLLNKGCTKDDLDWTLNPIRPKIETLPASNITGQSAVLQANVIHNGGKDITERGFCYGQQANPTINSSNVLKTSGGIGQFNLVLNGLNEATSYFIRSFAVNEVGVSYGNEIKITTGTLPKVETVNATDIAPQGARLFGKVLNDGGSAILERGFYVGKSNNPTSTDLSFVHQQNSLGDYSIQISALSPLTTYYYRAFVKTTNGVAMGAVKTFTTLDPNCLPFIVSIQPTNITATAFTAGGNVTNDNGQSITARGLVWGTANLPTITSGNKTSNGTGLGQFSTTISGLTPNTIYYVRAYATNVCGTQYGTQYTVTLSCLPSVSTLNVSNIASNSASCGGTVSSDNSYPITSRGIVWDINPNPTTGLSTKTTNGSGNGTFTSTMQNLNPDRFYYVRAYATNSCGTSYGQELGFRTAACQVSLETTSPSNITASSAILGGNIISNGGSSITSRGVVWSTSPNPTTALSTKASSGSGSGSFTINISNLSANTQYYVRAYAINSCGTFYGSQQSFKTTSSSFTGTITIGTGTSSESSVANPAVTPFGSYYSDARHIYLIRASEITSQGGMAGNIASISFDLVSRANITMNNFTIRFGSTTISDLSTDNSSLSFDITGNFIPFNMANFTTGWREFLLPSNSTFYWDGIKNIIIEVCFDNSSYNQNTTVRFSNTSFYSNLLNFKDNDSGCSLPFMYYHDQRPNMRLTFK